MRTVTRDELTKILADHKKWRLGEEGVARANLAGADLAGADLAGAVTIDPARLERLLKIEAAAVRLAEADRDGTYGHHPLGRRKYFTAIRAVINSANGIP